MSEAPLAFGELLRRLRSAAGLSQEDLAGRSGVSRNGISDLERGLYHTPRFETVRMLADALTLSEDARAALIAAARPMVRSEAPIARRPRSLVSLPVPLTPLIGRETELAALSADLQDRNVRLLTVTGPGGVGKTRLALAAAAELLDDFPDGVWFVDLTPLRDADLVLITIARALGVREQPGHPLTDSLARFLASKRMLLIVDNFEQVIAAASDIATVLSASPQVTLLATSREALRVRGERAIPVPPLPLPVDGDVADVEQLARVPAIALFVERARARRADFALTPDNAADIAAICWRLDGLPLALELAAARTSVLAPAKLLSRLERRLPMLTGGDRDLPARQRTMRNAIAWSHDLLRPQEQTLFRQLAVFAGGFEFAAAEAVANPDGAVDVFAGLTALVDHNLVRQAESSGSEPRFTMLETIREFGLEQLAGSGEDAATRARHAAHFGALLDRPTAMMLPHLPNTRQVLDRFLTEYPNLRAALEWHRTTGDVSRVLELAGALNYFWRHAGQLVDGRMWLEWGLSQESSTPEARAIGQLGLAGVLYAQSEGERALALCQACLEHYEATSDPFGAAFAAHLATLIAMFLGEPTAAMGYLEEARAQFAQLPGIPGQVAILNHLTMVRAWATFLGGDTDAAAAILQATAARQRGETQGTGSPELYLGWTLLNLGHVRRAQGDLRAALGHYQAALEHSWPFHEIRCCVRALMGTAGVLVNLGQWSDAARLFGAAEAFSHQHGLDFGDVWDLERALGLPEPWQQDDTPLRKEADLLRTVVRARGGGDLPPLPAPERAAEAWALGKALAFEAAMAEALSVDPIQLAETAADHPARPRSTESVVPSTAPSTEEPEQT